MTMRAGNTGGKRQPRPSGVGRVRSKAFSWSAMLKLPTLNQTRFRIGSREVGDLWMDTNP